MPNHVIHLSKFTVPLLGSLASGFSQGIITTVVGTDWSFSLEPLPALKAPLGSSAG
jgi:hypothetical protein